MIITYLKLFCTFAKIGMFTIGGGYAMIPLIEREIVKKNWMSKDEFMEMFALTQSLPGVFAVNISIFVGYKLHKVSGSLVCALATILPFPELLESAGLPLHWKHHAVFHIVPAFRQKHHTDYTGTHFSEG